MKRKIYEQLLKRKSESDGHTALLIDGARRVGKSYIAEEFARNEYDETSQSVMERDFAALRSSGRSVHDAIMFAFRQTMTSPRSARFRSAAPMAGRSRTSLRRPKC